MRYAILACKVYVFFLLVSVEFLSVMYGRLLVVLFLFAIWSWALLFPDCKSFVVIHFTSFRMIQRFLCFFHGYMILGFSVSLLSNVSLFILLLYNPGCVVLFSMLYTNKTNS